MNSHARRTLRRMLRRGRGPLTYVVFLAASLAAFLSLVKVAAEPQDPSGRQGVEMQVTPVR